jgi:outer membrane protein TolC
MIYQGLVCCFLRFPRYLKHHIVIAVCLAMLLPSICSSQTQLGSIRQRNASVVLQNYRARPLAVANLGQSNITLHDCRRIALGGSLDIQTAIWEEVVRENQAKASRVKMLPSIKLRYDLTARDRLPFSRSDVLGAEGAFEVVGPGPGTGVTNFSNSRERPSRKWQAELTWSPMDAAIARYVSHVKLNDAVHARYQRARVAQQLTGTVTAAFYRLLALTRALPKARALVSNRKSIVRDLESLSDSSLVEPREYLIAKAFLAEAEQQLSDTYVQMGKQRELLASAMNVCPDSAFNPRGTLLPLPPFNLEACNLESAALLNRPEAYQADLTHLSSYEDFRASIVRFFPRVEGFIGYFRDENKFQLTRYWTDGGLRITWDLMDFCANLMNHQAAEGRFNKTEREQAVISMAILSQVRLRTLEAMQALEEFRKTSRLKDQAAEGLRIARSQEEAKQRGAERQVIRIARQKALCEYLKSDIDRLASLGEVHAALAAVETAVGTNYPVAAVAPVPTRSYIPRIPLKPSRILSGAAGLIGSLSLF